MYDKSRGTQFHLVTVLILVITLTSINVFGLTNPLATLHHNYEDETDLDLLGYNWEALDPANTIQVLISPDFSYTGENSLVIESYTFASETYLSIPLNLEFNQLDSTNNFFSLYFYSFGQRISVVRLIFLDSTGRQLSLDYGYSGTAWEPVPIFNIDSEFPENEWFWLSRDLKSDIEFALNFDGSYYPDGYTPIELLELFIFQPLDDGLYVNFIDDLIFADSPVTEIEFNGNDDLTKYRNVGNVDPISRGILDIDETTSENLPYLTDLGLPVDGVRLGLLIGIPLIVAIIVILLLRRRK
ncbi:MAG: hypothetical protein GPJ54_03710 [Candidatus Heimdallarchaeota archaeon]|nr:hypothetical protein [Candidatus Heimdallarchaeota archaeon]